MKTKSVVPLYYKLLRKLNLIIRIYTSVYPDLIPNYVGFTDEFFLNKINER